MKWQTDQESVLKLIKNHLSMPYLNKNLFYKQLIDEMWNLINQLQFDPSLIYNPNCLFTKANEPNYFYISDEYLWRPFLIKKSDIFKYFYDKNQSLVKKPIIKTKKSMQLYQDEINKLANKELLQYFTPITHFYKTRWLDLNSILDLYEQHLLKGIKNFVNTNNLFKLSLLKSKTTSYQAKNDLLIDLFNHLPAHIDNQSKFINSKDPFYLNMIDDHEEYYMPSCVLVYFAQKDKNNGFQDFKNLSPIQKFYFNDIFDFSINCLPMFHRPMIQILLDNKIISKDQSQIIIKQLKSLYQQDDTLVNFFFKDINAFYDQDLINTIKHRTINYNNPTNPSFNLNQIINFSFIFSLVNFNIFVKKDCVNIHDNNQLNIKNLIDMIKTDRCLFFNQEHEQFNSFSDLLDINSPIQNDQLWCQSFNPQLYQSFDLKFDPQWFMINKPKPHLKRLS